VAGGGARRERKLDVFFCQKDPRCLLGCCVRTAVHNELHNKDNRRREDDEGNLEMVQEF
jgi:hypothetical protein